MSPERRDIPDWAKREREQDLSWINENVGVFQIAAKLAYGSTGRGAIVADTTFQAEPGFGQPFAYFSQEQVKEYDDLDMMRLVEEYDPEHEFVVVLLKSNDRTSIYRVRPTPRQRN